MSSIIMAEWTVIPLSAPQPRRHCPTCAQSRNFSSSGRVRLNANGKQMDAWLIYKCAHCDQTWNRPILERRPVCDVDATDLQAMQDSDPDWVRAHEFDVTALKRHCAQLSHTPQVTLVRVTQQNATTDWSEITLQLKPQHPTGLRLERVICQGWQMSRSQLQKLERAGNIAIEPQTKNALKRPLLKEVTLRVFPEGLTPEAHAKITNAFNG